MDQFRRDIDGLFDRFLGDFGDSGNTRARTRWPAIESFFRDGSWIMRVELPGVDPKDIDVSAVGNILTIRASRERRNEKGDQNYGYQELSYRTFERSVTLPSGVKSDQINARYQNGVLELSMPMPVELAGRKIPVTIGAEERKQIDHKSA
jgi:HSP20 family protein